jgi:alanine racemase
MSVKNAKIGERVYRMELVSLAERKMKSTLIPIGYSHGYSRLSNRGRVLIKGQQCIVTPKYEHDDC